MQWDNQLSVNGDTIAYDAENRQVSATDDVTHAVENYVYDGAGQRVEKSAPSGTAVYVYDAKGQLSAEYSTVAAHSRCTTCYLSYDRPGSVRMVTDQNASVIARTDYLPFGEEIPGNIAGRYVARGRGDRPLMSSRSSPANSGMFFGVPVQEPLALASSCFLGAILAASFFPALRLPESTR